MTIKGKTVLVTGGSGGIGAALVKKLLARGARVFSIDRVKPLEAAKNVTTLLADITNGQEVQVALKKVTGPIDILINNAGVMRRGKILDLDEKDFDFLFDINVKGSWLTLKQALPYLAKKPTILFVSSRHGQFLPVDPALYGLTKKMIIHLGELLEATYSNWDVKIICPGPIDTPLTWVGVKKEDLVRKKKLVRSPEYLAAKIIKLLESRKKRLMFDPKKWNEIIA